MSSFEHLVSGDEAKNVYSKRSKKFDEKTISASKKEALALKVKGEQEDGWSIARRNKKSVRVSKPKPQDRQLEDDVWCMFYRFGFKELNADRNFTIQVNPTAPARQIDVFAKEDDTIFIVECTHSQEQKSKSIKGLIDKINGIREDVIKAIHNHYGRKPKLKVKFVIATKNIDLVKADLTRAEDSKIPIITEQDIDYYFQLTSHLKKAAKFQFLARYLKDERVDGLKVKVPATKGKMGGVDFYNFLISPFELLKVAYISHKAISNNSLDTYQRMLKPKRLKKIAAFIDNGGQFPTNIVINFKSSKKLKFNRKEGFENSDFGELELPGQYGSAWIIDGQHRLYGFAFSGRGENHVLPVLAYENLPADEEKHMFVNINSEQVKVQRALLNEIYADLNIESEDIGECISAQYARIALTLDQSPNSPIYNRVVIASKRKTHFRCLTITSLADGMRENRLLGNVYSDQLQMGPLSHISGDTEATISKAVDVISGYFNIFAKELPEKWELGDAKGGFLCTNNGQRALLKLLKELILVVESRDNIKAYMLDGNDIIERVTPFLTPIVKYFREASPDQIDFFRKNQALAGVKRNCLHMMYIINEAIPEFTNKEIEEYINSRDEEGTKDAREMIDQINKKLFDNVLNKLKETYGTDDKQWWWEGIPKRIREKCVKQQNEESGKKEEYQYLYLIDYGDIIVHNWDLFEKEYDFLKKGKRADRVSWIRRINSIRSITHHPEKGSISKEEVKFVKDIYAFMNLPSN